MAESFGPNPAQARTITDLLRQLPGHGALADLSVSELHRAVEVLQSMADLKWVEAPPEIVTPASDDVLGMVLVFKAPASRLLVEALQSNKGSGRAPLPSASTVVGGVALPDLLTSPPATFPGFLLAIALAWTQAFARPIGYPEAALLHHMNQIAEERGTVTTADLEDAGRVLVDNYGYLKGGNSNEVAALLSSLEAWKCIERSGTGYRVRESVPFGLGRLEYVS